MYKYTPFSECYKKPQAVIRHEQNWQNLVSIGQRMSNAGKGNPDADWLWQQQNNILASLNPFTPFVTLWNRLYTIGTRTRIRGGRRLF